MLVPVGDPFPHVLLERCDGGVHSTVEQLLGEITEPTLDLIDPRGPGRSEMDMEPWMFHQPVSDGDGFVGREVVADDVHVEFGWDRFVDRDQKLLEFDSPVPAMQRGMTVPSAISNAANKLVTPERT